MPDKRMEVESPLRRQDVPECSNGVTHRSHESNRSRVARRPAFFAVLIMVVSFLPVFALQGIDGRMYQPLAWTKTLTLLSVAFLTAVVVPVFCSVFIRGTLRKESDSRLIRSIVGVYRPCLSYLLDRPLPLVVFIGMVLVLGSAATGIEWLVRLTTIAAIGFAIYFSVKVSTKIILSSLLLGVGLTASIMFVPIRIALRLPLDEGMVMDMPVTVPRITIPQAIDDLKARNMILCRFPEIAMVTGKAGPADTAFDPAPLDMMESMVEFQTHAFWPRRRLRPSDAKAYATDVLAALVQAKLIDPPSDEASVIREIVDAGLKHFDAIQRETCWQLRQVILNKLSRELAPDDDLVSRLKPIAVRHARALSSRQNAMLYARSAGTWTQIVLSEIFERQAIVDESLAQSWDQVLAARHPVQSERLQAENHQGLPSFSKLPIIDPHP